jgi:uncharacterized protein
LSRAGAPLLVVNVAELLRTPGATRDVDAELALADLDVSDARFSGEEVDVTLHLVSLANGIVVRGHLRAGWHGTCRRCLAAVEGSMDVDVDELYQVVVTDPDAFPVVDEQIDLAPMVRETLLLDVPDAPLCRDDCAGLCPVCGIDRNLGTCSCVVEVRDERWAALDALRRDSR